MLRTGAERSARESLAGCCSARCQCAQGEIRDHARSLKRAAAQPLIGFIYKRRPRAPHGHAGSGGHSRHAQLAQQYRARVVAVPLGSATELCTRSSRQQPQSGHSSQGWHQRFELAFLCFNGRQPGAQAAAAGTPASVLQAEHSGALQQATAQTWRRVS